MRTLHLVASFFNRLRRGAHLDPLRDWLVMLTLSAILLVGIVVWNVWAFDTVARGGVIGSPSTATSSAFSRASLDAIQTIFADRTAEEAKYVTGVYRYTDPSQ